MNEVGEAAKCGRNSNRRIVIENRSECESGRRLGGQFEMAITSSRPCWRLNLAECILLRPSIRPLTILVSHSPLPGCSLQRNLLWVPAFVTLSPCRAIQACPRRWDDDPEKCILHSQSIYTPDGTRDQLFLAVVARAF
jgi:hypothetical protein